MDNQVLFDLILGAVMSVIGWFARVLWYAVAELKSDLSKLREEIPSHYIVKDDYREDVRELKDMIGKIFDILEKRREKL